MTESMFKCGEIGAHIWKCLCLNLADLLRGKRMLSKDYIGSLLGGLRGQKKSHIFNFNGHSNLPNPVLIAYLYGKNEMKVNILWGTL